MYKNYFKLLIDFVLAFLAIVILMPYMLIVGLLIFADMGMPVLFIQERPGLNGKIFRLFKFRTMNYNNDNSKNLLPPVKRITKLGRFLRKSSIDELPELFNILKGEMSFVGPRPLLVRYLPYYSEKENKRHLVRPGLTGLAQINGRNAISWDDKFGFDVWYVENISFKLDIKIFILTLLKVVKHEGINADPDQIVMPFDDYLKSVRINKSLDD
jgi:undecaprenyl phosphate N,N'-diacetylbacillosamine 1-phosphate transferase